MIIYKYWQQLITLWQKAAFLWGAFFILFNAEKSDDRNLLYIIIYIGGLFGVLKN